MGGPPPAGRGGNVPPYGNKSEHTGKMQRGRKVTVKKSNKGFFARIKSFFGFGSKAKAGDLKDRDVQWVKQDLSPKFESDLKLKVADIKQRLFAEDSKNTFKELVQLKDSINCHKQQLFLRKSPKNKDINTRLKELTQVEDSVKETISSKKDDIQKELKNVVEQEIDVKLPHDELADYAQKLGLKEGVLNGKTFDEKVEHLEKQLQLKEKTLKGKRETAQEAVAQADLDLGAVKNVVIQKERARDEALAKLEINHKKSKNALTKKQEAKQKELRELKDTKETLQRSWDAASNTKNQANLAKADAQIQELLPIIESAAGDLSKLTDQNKNLTLTHKNEISQLQDEYAPDIAKAKEVEKGAPEAFKKAQAHLNKVIENATQESNKLDSIDTDLQSVRSRASEIRSTHLKTSPLIKNLVKIALIEKAFVTYTDFKLSPEKFLAQNPENLLKPEEKEALVKDWSILSSADVNSMITAIKNEGGWS